MTRSYHYLSACQKSSKYSNRFKSYGDNGRTLSLVNLPSTDFTAGRAILYVHVYVLDLHSFVNESHHENKFFLEAT